ncbi:hypothetical protein DFH07DRAFT_776801 [Mycena maculata]|uniref:Uncharacterized protein n=1 Tax=Mycena maculata TaxID=230809 RepID=A0AAD7N4H1_9AGAR|nr:hypothetical protein DFH07DRAFT_776801 [Mycena maculata]
MYLRGDTSPQRLRATSYGGRTFQRSSEAPGSSTKGWSPNFLKSSLKKPLIEVVWGLKKPLSESREIQNFAQIIGKKSPVHLATHKSCHYRCSAEFDGYFLSHFFLSSRTSRNHFSEKTTQISVSKSHILDSKIANLKPLLRTILWWSFPGPTGLWLPTSADGAGTSTDLGECLARGTLNALLPDEAVFTTCLVFLPTGSVTPVTPTLVPFSLTATPSAMVGIPSASSTFSASSFSASSAASPAGFLVSRGSVEKCKSRLMRYVLDQVFCAAKKRNLRMTLGHPPRAESNRYIAEEKSKDKASLKIRTG